MTEGQTVRDRLTGVEVVIVYLGESTSEVRLPSGSTILIPTDRLEEI